MERWTDRESAVSPWGSCWYQAPRYWVGPVLHADQGLTVRVNLYNYAQLPVPVVATARKTAATVFRRVGVNVIWADVPTSPEEVAAISAKRRRVGAAELMVRLVSEPMVPHWARQSGTGLCVDTERRMASVGLSASTPKGSRGWLSERGYSIGPSARLRDGP